MKRWATESTELIEIQDPDQLLAIGFKKSIINPNSSNRSAVYWKTLLGGTLDIFSYRDGCFCICLGFEYNHPTDGDFSTLEPNESLNDFLGSWSFDSVSLRLYNEIPYATDEEDGGEDHPEEIAQIQASVKTFGELSCFCKYLGADLDYEDKIEIRTEEDDSEEEDSGPKETESETATETIRYEFPVPDRSDFKPNRSKTQENEDLDIGWGEWKMSDGRPYRVEMWAADQISYVTIFMSRKGFEDLTDEGAIALLEREDLVHFKSDAGDHITVQPYEDPSGNSLWSITVTVGSDDQTFIVDNFRFFPYKGSR